jgi:hypothetical protein
MGSLLWPGERHDGALGEGTVTDFTTARAAAALGFSDGVAWEIVVMEVALGALEFHGVERLFHARGAERYAREYLG